MGAAILLGLETMPGQKRHFESCICESRSGVDSSTRPRTVRFAVYVGQGYEQLRNNWAENVQLRGGETGTVSDAPLSSPQDVMYVA